MLIMLFEIHKIRLVIGPYSGGDIESLCYFTIILRMHHVVIFLLPVEIFSTGNALLSFTRQLVQ